MKTLLKALFVVGLVVLHLHVDAKRFISEETKKAKFDYQIGRKLEEENAIDDSKPDGIPKTSGTYGNPITGSLPSVDANHGTKTDNTATNNNSDDEKNDAYGKYGNPFGSTTRTHRDRRPPH
ncbi:hypothetical protein L1049_020042 [Liquidambar formosana]|uniref:Uncharacterized protein n=1 Tax=Liquidambar formosana TaxID=63359 RepID=A0AAP0S7D1_LIQFO